MPGTQKQDTITLYEEGFIQMLTFEESTDNNIIKISEMRRSAQNCVYRNVPKLQNIISTKQLENKGNECTNVFIMLSSEKFNLKQMYTKLSLCKMLSSLTKCLQKSYLNKN